jgi:hypothetical protein
MTRLKEQSLRCVPVIDLPSPQFQLYGFVMLKVYYL